MFPPEGLTCVSTKQKTPVTLNCSPLQNTQRQLLPLKQQVTTPVCTKESLARRPPGPEPSVHMGALKGRGPPGTHSTCS